MLYELPGKLNEGVLFGLHSGYGQCHASRGRTEGAEGMLLEPISRQVKAVGVLREYPDSILAAASHEIERPGILAACLLQNTGLVNQR